MEHRHLKYTEIARKIKKKQMQPSVRAFTNIPTAETKKEALGIVCIGLEIARRAGEKIKPEEIQHYYNKLKGRNNIVTQKEISHIFQEGANLISGRTIPGDHIRKELEIRSNKNMTKIVAETVLETMLPQGSASIITESSSGWQQFIIAVFVVLGLKVVFKKRR